MNTLDKEVLAKTAPRHRCKGIFASKGQNTETVIINGISFEADVPKSVHVAPKVCD